MTHLKKDNSNKKTKSQNDPNHRQNNDKMFLLPLNVNVLKNHKKNKHGLLPPIDKLLTVTNKKTGQVHLALREIAYEKSEHNKWSRRKNSISHENAKTTSRFHQFFN